jgi:hypothetical protein
MIISFSYERLDVIMFTFIWLIFISVGPNQLGGFRGSAPRQSIRTSARIFTSHQRRYRSAPLIMFALDDRFSIIIYIFSLRLVHRSLVTLSPCARGPLSIFLSFLSSCIPYWQTSRHLHTCLDLIRRRCGWSFSPIFQSYQGLRCAQPGYLQANKDPMWIRWFDHDKYGRIKRLPWTREDPAYPALQF